MSLPLVNFNFNFIGSGFVFVINVIFTTFSFVNLVKFQLL